MARPPFLLCDTDALIQFFLVKEVRPLTLLHRRYSIQPVIVPEVEIELYSNRKLGHRISGEFRKALASGVIRVLDQHLLESHFGSPPASSLAAKSTLAQIAAIGKQHQVHVGLGEAYTHAAALALDVPALSHDRSALDTLLALNYKVPATVLRAFDLVTLCYQVNDMAESECENFRSNLESEHEYLPRCFRRRSFGDGLRAFQPRVRDSATAPVANSAVETLPFSTQLVL